MTPNPAVRVDVRDAVARARKLLSGGACQVDPQMLAGELLPGWYDDWVLVERERLRMLCLEAMKRMAQCLLDSGPASLAIEAALAVVTAEPLRESAHRVLIDAHVAAGNRGEALWHYDRCQVLLRDELGLNPGEAVAAAAARSRACCRDRRITQRAGKPEPSHGRLNWRRLAPRPRSGVHPRRGRDVSDA